MAEFFVETRDLSVGYNGVPLIQNIRMHVDRGEILTLIGPNGAGKSTILRSIIRQLAPVGGAVLLNGRKMSDMNEKEISRTMSVLMTDRIRPELMTCEDVVNTGRYPYTGRLGILNDHDHKVVEEAMAMVHALELRERSFDKISDGQRQRILLARAICQEPEVIVLDEPTSFLDVRHKLELLAILKQMVRERNVAVIMSLHELDLAQRISDRIICVSERGVEAWGTPEEIFSGDRIRQLYGITKGSFYEPYGCPELERVTGKPRVFVIGGSGSGIPVYRSLQRRGIPFAAGVLPENDLDYPVACALASEVISEKPFWPISQEAVSRALEVMAQCEYVVCTLRDFGPMNNGNDVLRFKAKKKLIPMEALQDICAGKQPDSAGQSLPEEA